ncbi:hypothetical protein SR70_22105 [Klebsiella aerogenes]|uniref:hypothetical protein n=1 Tax=Klebsiella aerogenes TaxID=548 RepID=UPI0005EEA196|nr:hypothetical protein [Klebsiella aerogenes]EMB5777426.1 hypothetical protein [Klebsiella aerogenes]KJP35605.1 hypothetical protein SR70_22105 [Klebsiella aerogenes]KUQ16380.1 hypothetical protein AWI08_06430 [Klebsiella aerogenes]MBS6146324.1 hypothetical protein [Klebsiella aerogenes]
MATLDDIFWKFGYASEAAQLLEVELINVIIAYEIKQGGDIPKLKEKFLQMDKFTLSKLSRLAREKGLIDDEALQHMTDALRARNYLAHNFYRAHNFAKDTPEGRQEMLDDLKKTHNIIFEAYRKVMLISGDKIPPLGDD